MKETHPNDAYNEACAAAGEYCWELSAEILGPKPAELSGWAHEMKRELVRKNLMDAWRRGYKEGSNG